MCYGCGCKIGWYSMVCESCEWNKCNWRHSYRDIVDEWGHNTIWPNKRSNKYLKGYNLERISDTMKNITQKLMAKVVYLFKESTMYPFVNFEISNCKYLITYNPVDTGRKLNVHKTFRRRPRRLLNVLCTFNLRPVSTGKKTIMIFCLM